MYARAVCYDECPTKVLLLLLSVLLCFSSSIGSGPRLLRLDVPSIADPRWERVILRCEYDLNGKELYSVKWYKDGVEFFSFNPSSKPMSRYSPVEGVLVDVAHSDSRQVTLFGPSSVKLKLAGSYCCEVSSEGPSFSITYGEANMSIAILPKMPPVLDGVRTYYQVGELLQAECSSALSYPPAVLTFFLNGKEVQKTMTSELANSVDMGGSLLSTTRLTLSLRLEEHHFTDGSLSLICQSFIPGVPSARALRTEKTVALVATSNHRLAQKAPKSTLSSVAASLLFSAPLHYLFLCLLLHLFLL